MAATEDTRSPYLLDMVEKAKGSGAGPMGTHKITIGPVFFNLPVAAFASVLIWGLAIYCMAAPEEAKESLGEWQTGVTNVFTWLYISSNGIWLFFILIVYYYYGNVRLGKDGEKPQFDDANYFMMIFTAGVAVGLFFYGASEPMWHYIGSNRYAKSGYMNDNEKAQHAINLTLYHWGVHGWVVYSMTAICLGILSYRYDLPLTYRTCFFPIFGKATWGWIGDLIDACTIAGSIAGVCTSLGLGAQQVVTGAQRINWIAATCVEAAAEVTGNMTAASDPDPIDCLSEGDITGRRVIVIGVITLAATVSVVTGLDVGIKLLSQIAFGSGMVIWSVVFILDDPWYLLNLMVQSFGFYIQWIMQLGWFTDAFAQLGFGEGRAMDGKGASAGWMDGWTIFYWGWWISWSPFVGIFLARISRGRTIRDVINFTFSIPLIYCILWFCTFGGAGIKMHRRAELLEKAGKELYGDSTQFLTEGTTVCFDVPATMPCPDSIAAGDAKTNCPAYTGTGYESNPNVSPVCKFPGKTGSDGYWFDLVESYYQVGGLLAGFSIFTICIYFITSSDSGSLVVDYIACNGEEAHTIQRVYWALTEGGLAMALLIAGGADALKALRSVSIVSGVPLTIFCCFICLSLWRVLQYDGGHLTGTEYEAWSMPVFGGVLEYLEFGFSAGQSPLPQESHCQGVLLSTFFPPATMFLTYRHMLEKDGGRSLGVPEFIALGLATIAWVGFLASIIAQIADPSVGMAGFVFFFYGGFATILVAQRIQVRTLYNIEGGGIRDFLAAFFCYPQAVWQLRVQVKEALPDPEKQPVANTVSAPAEVSTDTQEMSV